MERLIDIDDKYLRLLRELLKEHLMNKTVWAYGSRVKWNANPTSDLDLVVWGASNSQATRAIDAFAESNLPFTVQLFIWEDIPDNFKENIRNKYVVLQEEKNIPNGWREVKLGDVAKLNSQSIDKSYPYQEILYLDTGSITENKVSDLQLFRIKEAPSRAKRLVKNNDIIYSTVRPIQRHYGFIKKPPKNLVVSTGFSVIETNNKFANPIFIYSVLSSKDVIEELDAIAEGATSVYPSIRPDDIENLQILLPPLSEQKAIAEILSSIDDKIDLLQRQNKTLEGLAQTLFRKWFIEDADERWEKKNLDEVIDINPKYGLKKGTIAPYLSMSNINTDSYAPSNWYNRDFQSGMQFKNGDTLFQRIGISLEKCKTCFVDFLKEDEIGWGSTEYIVMRSKPDLPLFLSYVIAKDNDFRNHAIGTMTGTTRQRAQAKDLSKYPIYIPPLSVLEKFNKQCEDIVCKLRNNTLQIRTLDILRDKLLPKLINGEIRVVV